MPLFLAAVALGAQFFNSFITREREVGRRAAEATIIRKRSRVQAEASFLRRAASGLSGASLQAVRAGLIEEGELVLRTRQPLGSAFAEPQFKVAVGNFTDALVRRLPADLL